MLLWRMHEWQEYGRNLIYLFVRNSISAINIRWNYISLYVINSSTMSSIRLYVEKVKDETIHATSTLAVGNSHNTG